MESSVFVMAYRIFSCGMRLPEIESRPPALGVQSLSHWTTREIPFYEILKALLKCLPTSTVAIKKVKVIYFLIL